MLLGLGVLTVYSSGCYNLPETHTNKPDPNSAFKYYSKSLNQYLERDYDQALKNVNIAIKFNPFIAQFYHLKGDILKDISQYKEALSAYKKAISIRYYNPEIYEKMGIVSSDLKNYEQAIHYHKKALAQNAGKISLNLRIAENYYWMNYLQLALNFAENYRKKAILNDDKLDQEYERIMGNIKFASYEYESAKRFYENFFSENNEAHPQEAKALLHAYMELGEREHAYRFLLNKASGYLSAGDTHFFRGLYYYNSNNLKDARKQLELALESKTSEIDTYLYLGKIYYASEENSKALDMFRHYRKLGGDSIIEEAPL
jgi:tetratricopeptide (TPR) repeat protein